jgi:hypothetical protein
MHIWLLLQPSRMLHSVLGVICNPMQIVIHPVLKSQAEEELSVMEKSL